MPFHKTLVFACVVSLISIFYWLGWVDQIQWITLLITSITAVLWVTEWMPIPVASLIPIACLPLFGILSPTEVAAAYGSPLILLLLGGFLLSTALVHSHTHQFLAQRILNLVGTDSSKKLVMGFMLTAFLLSMWISNTATTLMLLPIALAVVAGSNSPRFATILILSIAYAASIGGTMTPIGTPPNLIMIENFRQGTGQELGFIDWMSQVWPMVGLFFPLMVILMLTQVKKDITFSPPDQNLTSMNVSQKRTLWVFAVTAILWITRTAPFGGWKQWLDLPQANDAAVALLAVVALFAIPRAPGSKDKLLNWETANTIPWGVLLLFAGGLAIATAFKATGLSALLASHLNVLSGVHPFWIILTVCLTITFLTEITSNTATTAIIMPILMSAAEGLQIRPEQLMIPAAISASCAFMLPVATAPNAIVFGSGHVPIKTMIRMGFKLNLLGAFIIAGVAAWWI